METRPASEAWFDRRGVWLLGAGALLPLFWCWRDFSQLFWFGDEWDQLDQISRHGFWRWMTGFFGENFAPVFKAIWGSLALGGGGRYFTMVLAVWVCHALAVALFARWLRAAGFSIFATTFAAMGFGLAASNFETLTWTIQLLTVLTMVFFFLAGHRLAKGQDAPWTGRSLLALAALVTLSSLSSARGVLSGICLASGVVMATQLSRRDRARLAGACLLPALVIFVLITRAVTGGPSRFAAGWGPPLQFACWHFALNPLHRWLDVSTFGPDTTVFFGAVKLALLGCGWKFADPARRRVLLPLLVLDVGTSLLLGIGRHHTGLGAVNSSRYQYIELICLFPFAAVCGETALRQLAARPMVQRTIAAIALATLVCIAAEPWPRVMRFMAESNGRKPRQALLVDPQPAAEGLVPGIDLSTARAKELIAEFHLR